MGPETAVLPSDWEERLIPIRNEATRGATGWCLDPYDLAYAKLAAGRTKDLEFVANLLRFRMIGPTLLKRHIDLAEDSGLHAILHQRYSVCLRMRTE